MGNIEIEAFNAVLAITLTWIPVGFISCFIIRILVEKEVVSVGTAIDYATYFMIFGYFMFIVMMVILTFKIIVSTLLIARAPLMKINIVNNVCSSIKKKYIEISLYKINRSNKWF